MPPTPKQWRLHFDGTVTAGNLIMAGALLAGVMVWGMRVESMATLNRIGVERNAASIQSLDETIERTMDAAETRLGNQISELRRVLLNRFNNTPARTP